MTRHTHGAGRRRAGGKQPPATDGRVYWITEEGERICVQAMTVSHLRNALRMLMSQEMSRLLDRALEGDAAAVHCVGAGLTPSQLVYSATVQGGAALVDEWRRRGLPHDGWAENVDPIEAQAATGKWER